jgi:hypothetical protein
MADAAAQQEMSALYYGEACTEAADMQSVQAIFASEGLHQAQSRLAEAQLAHQLLQSASAQQPTVEDFMRPPKPPDG